MMVRNVSEVPRAVFGDFGRIDLPIGADVDVPDDLAKELLGQGVVEAAE